MTMVQMPDEEGRRPIAQQGRGSLAGDGSERRQFGRVDLDEPLSGSLDGLDVQVLEISVTGMRLAHEARLPPATSRRLIVTVGSETMVFTCSVARSVLHRLARKAGEKTVYHSGVQLDESIGDSERMLRDLIAERVIRALDEQKANSRGVPPLGGYVYQVEKGDRFRRCEFVNGGWRKFDTTSTQQPEHGFTISAAVPPFHVDLLCRTYETTTPEGRRLTQILAQLSISKKEGTPTRKYVP